MIRIEGTIHEKELTCSVKSSQCGGEVRVTMDQFDYDVNNRITHIAVCEGCEGHIFDEI